MARGSGVSQTPGKDLKRKEREFMKKIQTETQAKDAAKVTALVTKLNRYRHEYYNLAAPGVSVADVTAYASNVLLILRFSA